MSAVLNPLERVALVFGASGITGWAILREVSHPTNTSFRRVIGLSNRPTDPSQLLLPDSDKITLASGVDLSAGVDQVTAGLSRIDNIEHVTDVFFAGGYLQTLFGSHRNTSLDLVQPTSSLREHQTWRDMRYSRRSTQGFLRRRSLLSRGRALASNSGPYRRVAR